MSNIVDKLFEHALHQLPQDNFNENLGWPEPDFIEENNEKNDLDGDSLTPCDHVFDRVIDKIRNEQTIFEPSEREKELIDSGVRARGVDAIAFYKSKRFISKRPFPGKWGIFYLKPGLDMMAWRISKYYPGYKDPRILAHDFLYAHEFFHFRADIQTLLFEFTLNKQLYIPLHNSLIGQQTQFVEEALANRAAYEWSKKSNVSIEEFAYDFISLQPNAYSRFQEPLEELCGEWAANTINLQPPKCFPRMDLAQWVEATPSAFLRRSLCPQYVIFPKNLETWISPAFIPPPIKQIIDGGNVKKVLVKRVSQIVRKWEETKRKLLENPMLPSLNFKLWRLDGPNVYSVRIDDNYRAHIEHQGGGNWLTIKLGSHKEMGHG